MVTIADLAEYVITGRPLLLFGAGPSAELGFPTWRQLAERLSLRLPPDSATARGVTREISAGRIPRALGLIQAAIGREKLIDGIESALTEVNPAQIGTCYSLLAALPFSGYITTNFDTLFPRHLAARSIAVTTLGNSRSHLASVDFDHLRTLVTIHGDLKGEEDLLVLTEADYLRVIQSPSFLYLRTFLSSHVLSRRLLVVGYSLQDPDVRVILSEAARILRRQVPIYAIIADAKQSDIEEWELTYNVRVFTYSNADGVHGELRRILSIIKEYSGDGAAPQLEAAREELRSAQHLFMWNKSRFGTAQESLDSAIDTLLLSRIVESGVQLAEKNAGDMVRPFLGSGRSEVSSVARMSLSRLQKKGYIGLRNGIVTPSPAGREQVAQAAGEFERLTALFKEQTAYDARSGLKDTTTELEVAISERALGAIVALFYERAIELFSALFRDKPASIRPSLGMLKLFTHYSQGLPREDAGRWLVAYCTRILREPRSHELRLLSLLARGFFCFQVLQLDREAFEVRLSKLSDRLALVDSNVLIPALARGHRLSDTYIGALEQARKIGIVIVALPSTVNEVVRAARWAEDLAQKKDDLALKWAAEGRFGYRPNQFIQAYVESVGAAGDLRPSFAEFLQSIFPSELSDDAVAKALKTRLDISVVAAERLVDTSQSQFALEQTKAVGEINNIASTLPYEKNPARVAAESEVFAIVVNWSNLRRDQWSRETCVFLSRGGMLNRVARELRVIIPVVMTLDGFLEVRSLLEPPEATMNLEDWLKTSYFDVSPVSDLGMRKFFAPLVGRVEEEYLKEQKRFQELLGKELSANYMDEVPYVDRPEFFVSLTAKANYRMRLESLNAEQLQAELRRAEREKTKAKRETKYWKAQARAKKARPKGGKGRR
jgi:hypothetical protein